VAGEAVIITLIARDGASTTFRAIGRGAQTRGQQIDTVSKHALQLGFDDEDVADSIPKLTSATGDAQQAISDLSIADDIARGRKIDLAAATRIAIAPEQGRT
jgi:hypothetical protein